MIKKQLLSHKKIILVATMIILAKTLNVLKDIVLTRVCGTNIVTDVFLMVYTVCITLFFALTSAFGTCYIPIYNSLKNEKRIGKFNFMAILVSVFFSLIVLLLYSLFKDFLVNSYGAGLNDSGKYYMKEIADVMIFSMPFIAMYNIFTSYLQNKGFTIIAAGYPVISSVTFIIGALFFYNGYKSLPAFVLVGNVLTFITLLIIAILKGFRISKCTDQKNELSDLFRMVIPIFLGIAMADINSMVDKGFAASLPTGTVTGLDYAYKLSSAIQSIVSGAVSIVVFPKVSLAYSCKDLKKVESIVTDSLKFICRIVIPMVVLCQFLTRAIVIVLYKNNGFNDYVLNITDYSFFIYNLAVIPLSIRVILEKVFWSEKNTSITMFFGALGVVVNIFLDFVLTLNYGYAGLASASVIAAIVTTILYIAKMNRQTESNFFISIPAMICNSIIMLLPSIAVTWVLSKCLFKVDSIVYMIRDAVICSIEFYAIYVLMRYISERVNDGRLMKN